MPLKSPSDDNNNWLSPWRTSLLRLPREVVTVDFENEETEAEKHKVIGLGSGWAAGQFLNPTSEFFLSPSSSQLWLNIDKQPPQENLCHNQHVNSVPKNWSVQAVPTGDVKVSPEGEAWRHDGMPRNGTYFESASNWELQPGASSGQKTRGDPRATQEVTAGCRRERQVPNPKVSVDALVQTSHAAKRTRWGRVEKEKRSD